MTAENPGLSNGQEFRVPRNEWLERAKILGVILVLTVTGGVSLTLIGSKDSGQKVLGAGGMGLLELGLAGIIYTNSKNSGNQNVEITLPKPSSQDSGGK